MSRLKKFAVLLFAAMLLAGCDLYGKIGTDDQNIQGALPALLRGEWVYIQPGLHTPAERYIIEENTIQYGYGGNDDGGSEYDFKGHIRFVSNYNNSSGVIIIEYIETERPSYAAYNGNSFFGIYYRNLKTNTVQLANAINLTDFTSPDTATLEEAIEKFTRLRMGIYVDWSVVQHQSRVQK